MNESDLHNRSFVKLQKCRWFVTSWRCTMQPSIAHANGQLTWRTAQHTHIHTSPLQSTAFPLPQILTMWAITYWHWDVLLYELSLLGPKVSQLLFLVLLTRKSSLTVITTTLASFFILCNLKLWPITLSFKNDLESVKYVGQKLSTHKKEDDIFIYVTSLYMDQFSNFFHLQMAVNFIVKPCVKVCKM